MTTRAAHAETGTTRTLADYRPQHDDNCGARRCDYVGYVGRCLKSRETHDRSRGVTIFHNFKEGPCSCGLDALLAAVRHEAVADRLHPHEDGADNDQARCHQPQSPVEPLAHASKTEPSTDNKHSRTCDLVGFRQGYNAPPVCSCGVDKGQL